MRGDEMKDLSQPAERLVQLAREHLGEMSAGVRAEGYLKLQARRSEGPRRRRIVLTLASVVVVVALFVLGRDWLGFGRAGALSYSVEGGQLDANGVVKANGGAEPTLQFSDGTEVSFLAGSRGQVRSVAEHGARISVAGKVRVSVVHWRGSHWLFDAGPFLITVTGTKFVADWRESDERLEVTLETGSIAVSGPLSDEAIALRAGQRLVISTRDKEVVIRDVDPDDRPSGPPTSKLGSDTLTAPSEAAAPALPSTGTIEAGPAAPNWSAELAAGRFAIILQQAEERGLDKVLADASSSELAALSDAARYSRRDDLARRTLLAQRRRFPQSSRASDAAFLLGRLEETSNRPDVALTWYERCLTEAPRGTYTSEALGRKMTVVERLHGAARARPIAEEYLRRFGDGTYAAAARALLRTP